MKFHVDTVSAVFVAKHGNGDLACAPPESFVGRGLLFLRVRASTRPNEKACEKSGSNSVKKPNPASDKHASLCFGSATKLHKPTMAASEHPFGHGLRWPISDMILQLTDILRGGCTSNAVEAELRVGNATRALWVLSSAFAHLFEKR